MPNQSTSRYILTALSIILVITAFILVALNAIQIQKRPGAVPAVSNGPLQIKTNVTTVGGTIQAVNGSSFTMKLDQLNGQVVAANVNDVRTVMVSASTSVMSMEQKAPAEFQKEMSAYSASLKTPLKPGSPMRTIPLPYINKKLTLSDLKAGMSVTLTGPNGFADGTTLKPTAITIR